MREGPVSSAADAASSRAPPAASSRQRTTDRTTVPPWVVMSMGERMGDSEGVGIVASLPAAAGPASDSEAESPAVVTPGVEGP